MPPNTTSPDTLIVVKVTYEGALRRFRLKLAECTPQIFPGKIRSFLEIPVDENVTIERYSDSLGAHTVLNEAAPGVYKQLYRAARAKQKLRVRVTKQAAVDSTSTTAANDNTTEASDAPASPESTTSSAPHGTPSKPLEKESAPTTTTDVAPVATPATQPTIHTVDYKGILGKLVSDYLEGQEFSEMLNDYVQLSVKKEVKKEVSAEVGKQLKEAPKPTTSTPKCPAVCKTALRPQSSPLNFVIFCNLCEKNITGTHYHCGSCENGDYDICDECREAGKHCKESDHWLIKRQLCNGRIISSTTENVIKAEKTEKKEPAVTHPKCNVCLNDITDNNFAICTSCKGFRICNPCTAKSHGHDPYHMLLPAPSADPKAFDLAKLRPGRDAPHNALCDKCNGTIKGIRHKCTSCPDFDYCDVCIAEAPFNHPGHNFVALAKSIGWTRRNTQRHKMILCDGPLCAGKPGQKSIIGDRYKCSVCPDTDFCGNCEAHPLNTHDNSHPLIKLRNPDQFVSVSTIFANEKIEDQKFSKNYFESSSSVSIQSNSSTLANESTVTDTQLSKEPELREEERNVEPEQPSPVVAEVKAESALTPPPAPAPTPTAPEALFVCDTINDKQTFPPNSIFTQTWTVKVVGKTSWPKGTTVSYVGGIPMKPEYGYNASVTQEEMELGDTVDFSVDFMAPASEINDVSLTSFWRLTTPDGLKFGPNLWCEIKVAEPKKVAPVVVEIPSLELAEEEEEVVEDEHIENNTEVEAAASQMIFPMLPKESPESSTHDFSEHFSAPGSAVAESVSSGLLVDDDLDSMSDDFENLSEDDFEFVASDGEESLAGHQ